MKLNDLEPGEVLISTPKRIDKMYRDDGSLIPYAAMRWHIVGFCIHKDRSSCEEGLDKGPLGSWQPAMLEAYVERPCRDSFSSDDEHEKACGGYKSLEEHITGFFKEFNAHNEE